MALESTSDRHGLRVGRRVRWAGRSWIIDAFLQGGGVMIHDEEEPLLTRTVQAFQLNAPQ